MDLVQIVNQTRATTIADRAEVARSFTARGKGLLGRDSMPHGSGLVIYPESSIHMLFMRFAIDAIFVDAANRVVACAPNLAPWTGIAGVAPWRCRYVIELPDGTIAATQTQLADQLALTPPLR